MRRDTREFRRSAIGRVEAAHRQRYDATAPENSHAAHLPGNVWRPNTDTMARFRRASRRGAHMTAYARLAMPIDVFPPLNAARSRKENVLRWDTSPMRLMHVAQRTGRRFAGSRRRPRVPTASNRRREVHTHCGCERPLRADRESSVYIRNTPRQR